MYGIISMKICMISRIFISYCHREKLLDCASVTSESENGHRLHSIERKA